MNAYSRAGLVLMGLLLPGPSAGQIRTRIVLLDSLPITHINACSARVEARRAAWGPVFEAAAMEGNLARALLAAFQDSIADQVRDRPDDVELNYLLAAVIGTRAEVESGRNKVRLAKALHAQIQVVLTLDPGHAGAQHLLGRLHGAVLRMDWLTRFIATRLMGASELAGASWDQAQSLLEAGVTGEPCMADHHWELARLYADRGEWDLARDRIRQLFLLDPSSTRDLLVIEMATELLRELDSQSE